MENSEIELGSFPENKIHHLFAYLNVHVAVDKWEDNAALIYAYIFNVYQLFRSKLAHIDI